MAVSPRALVAWAIGFASARILGYLETTSPTDFEVIQLSQELRSTQVALEGFTSCETSLRTEIRYSAGVDAQFRALLAVEGFLVVVYLLIEVHRFLVRGRVRVARPVEPIADSPDPVSTVTSPSSSGTPTRTGPVRPSDLKK